MLELYMLLQRRSQGKDAVDKINDSHQSYLRFQE